MSNLWQNVLMGVFGRNDSMTSEKLLNQNKRNPLSRYLPWLMYDPTQKVFINTDNTTGYFFELTPVTYAGMSQMQSTVSALKQPFPEGTVVQFIFYPDEDIDFLLKYYQEKKVRQNKIGQMMTAETTKFISEGRRGLKKNAHIPIRMFRSFVFVKSEKDISELIPTFEQMLYGAGVQPTRLDDKALISLASSIINNVPVHFDKQVSERDQSQIYTRDTPLRDYCISRETVLEFRTRPAKLAGRYAACLTPKVAPELISPDKTNAMFGGIMGVQDDRVQLNFPFLYSLNIIYESDRSTLENKAAITMSQNFAGKFVSKMTKRIDEFRHYGNTNESERYVKVIPTLWVFGDTKEELNAAVGRTKTVWATEAAGNWQIEREGILQQALFIASLPGGLYNVHGNVNAIDRHYYMSIEAAAAMAPVQGDFAGNGLPVSILLGRKGQLAGLDVFASGSTNHNYFVCAESGGGKSFFLGTLLFDAYMAGEKLRIVDLGRSYEKMCRIAGGKFIDFNRRSGKQVINPLDFHAHDEQDYTANIVAACTVIAAMVYSKSQIAIGEQEWGLVKEAVKWTLDQKRHYDGTNAVYDYLSNYKKYNEKNEGYMEELAPVARTLAYNMKNFTSLGEYGHFFVGKSTINISEDDFVVIELDDIKADPELFNVVVLQMMNEVTQDLYLSNRQNRRFILFEEAPTILKDNGAVLSYLGQMTAEGYRRARKYGGSFGVVMQSIMDTQLMGQLGQIVLSNAAYKFMLSTKSGQYAKACKEGVLDYDKFTENLLTSMRNNKPHYSEIFIESPQNRGVCRLIVDDFRYHVNTTESYDVAIFFALIDPKAGGLEAFDALDAIHRYAINSQRFETLTKGGLNQVAALQRVFLEANVPPEQYPQIFSRQDGHNEESRINHTAAV